jgi:hypothetical protein
LFVGALGAATVVCGHGAASAGNLHHLAVWLLEAERKNDRAARE